MTTKRFLAAAVDPHRIMPPSGPDEPRLEVHWQLTPPHDEFRIDYADPNVDFHCGWHRDADHPDLGDTHFQHKTDSMDAPQYEGVEIEAQAAAKILWECCEKLFGTVIPEQLKDRTRSTHRPTWQPVLRGNVRLSERDRRRLRRTRRWLPRRRPRRQNRTPEHPGRTGRPRSRSRRE